MKKTKINPIGLLYGDLVITAAHVLTYFVLIYSRSVGYRFGPHLAEAVPLLITYCTSASENDEELREYSLQARISASFLR